MAVVMTQDMPDVTEEMVAAVSRVIDLDHSPAPGLIVHTASPLPGGGMRIVDVWESEQALADFGQRRVGPAVEKVMAELGVGPDDLPPAPEQVISRATEVVVPR